MDEGTKFINSQTVAYLKSKAGSTLQQQIQNLKERIDLEGKDIDQIAQNQALDRHSLNEKLSVLGREILTIQASLTNDLIALDKLNQANLLTTIVLAKNEKNIKQLAVVVGILLVGVAICLVRSLI